MNYKKYKYIQILIKIKCHLKVEFSIPFKQSLVPYIIFIIFKISSNNSFLYVASILTFLNIIQVNTFGPHLIHSLVYAFLQVKQKLCPQGITVTGSTISLLQKLQFKDFIISF